MGGWSVVSFLPRVGFRSPWARRRSAYLAKSPEANCLTVSLKFRLDGYTVLSVRGYDIQPFTYKFSATRMALAALKPMLEAARMNSVVENGTGGYSAFGSFLYSATVPVFTILERAVSAFCFSVKRLPMWPPTNSSPSTKVAYNSQYGVGIKAFMSLSLSTSNASSGVCTLPTDRKLFPSRPQVNEIYLVRAAPHTRSIFWRASPAAAKLKSSGTVCENACSISCFVMALYRARSKVALGFASLMIL